MHKRNGSFFSSSACLGIAVLLPMIAGCASQPMNSDHAVQIYRLDTYANAVSGRMTGRLGFINTSNEPIDKVDFLIAGIGCGRSGQMITCSHVKQVVTMAGPFDSGSDVDQWIPGAVLGPCPHLVGMTIYFQNGTVGTVPSEDMPGYMTTQAMSGGCPLAPDPIPLGSGSTTVSGG